MKNEIHVRVGSKKAPTNSPLQDYLVTVFKALKSGDLYALTLRVTVAEAIEWVRVNVDEIVAIGSQQDAVARNNLLPIVALNVEVA